MKVLEVRVKELLDVFIKYDRFIGIDEINSNFDDWEYSFKFPNLVEVLYIMVDRNLLEVIHGGNYRLKEINNSDIHNKLSNKQLELFN